MVIPLTGELVTRATDFMVPVRGPEPLGLVRTYRTNHPPDSLSGSQGPTLGNWNLNWDKQFFDNGASLDFTDGDGRSYTYTVSPMDSGDNTLYSSPAGFYETVKATRAAGEITLLRVRKRSGLVEEYRPSQLKRLLLTRREDRNGNVLTFGRSSLPAQLGQLLQITDDLGRVTTLNYDVNKRLNTLVDFSGRTWTYLYTAGGLLKEVQLPSTIFQNEASVTAPGTRNYKYIYDASDRLATIIDPRDAISADAPILSLAYDGAGRVSRQDFFQGSLFYRYELAGGLVAATQLDRNGDKVGARHDSGGNMDRFEAFTNRGINPNDPGSFVTQYKYEKLDTLLRNTGEVTTVILPRGNVHEYDRDGLGNILEHRRKVADGSDSDTDLVRTWTYDSSFSVPLTYIEERGNAPGISTARRNAFTIFYFYDHEFATASLANLNTRLANAGTSLQGMTVTDLQQFFQTTDVARTGLVPDPVSAGARYVINVLDGLLERGGNLILVRLPKATVPGSSEPQLIEARYAYTQFGQRSRYIEPDGNVTAYLWDTRPFATSDEAGYLKSSIRSVDDLNLATLMSYDGVGNVLAHTNPRGYVTTYLVDDANLVTRVIPPQPFDDYDRSFIHDANGNRIVTQIANVLPGDDVAFGGNGDGIDDGGGELRVFILSPYLHRYTFDRLNFRVTQDLDAQFVDPIMGTTITKRLVTTFRYDANQHRIAIIKPEGNRDEWIYDERDQVFAQVRGAGDSSVREVSAFTYDGNRNPIAVLDDDGNDLVATSEFDLFDRPVLVTDEVGNTTETLYDAASLVIQVIRRGPKAEGEPRNTTLSDVAFSYDEMQRRVRSDALFFDTQTGAFLADGPATPGDGRVTTFTRYRVDSLVASVTDDNLHTTTFSYDTANRQIAVSDHLGNKVTSDYDRADNVVHTVEVEKTEDGTQVEAFHRFFAFDVLDRKRAQVDELGNTTRFMYDSRNNLVESSDAEAAEGLLAARALYVDDPNGSRPGPFAVNPTINGRGNRSLYSYDGINRPILTERLLSPDGTGDTTAPGGDAGRITTIQSWDDNSRPLSQKDDNGNQTTNSYDHKDRLIEVALADGTRRSFRYDRVDNLIQATDANGTTTVNSYDAIDRLVTRNIVLATNPTDAGVTSTLEVGQTGDTSFETFRYDGLSRVTQADDNDSRTSIRYDSLSQPLNEEQTVEVGAKRVTPFSLFSASAEAKNIGTSYDGVGNRLTLSYPGNFVVSRIPDVLDRARDIVDQTNNICLTHTTYIGPSYRELGCVRSNGVDDAHGYDDARRLIRKDHRNRNTGQRIVGFQNARDRVGNRHHEIFLRTDTSAGTTTGRGEYYDYDSIYRLRDYRRNVASGNLSTINNVSTSVMPGPQPGDQPVLALYNLDDVGNRTSVTTNGTPENYTLQVGGTESDSAVNQYTAVGGATLRYDKNGNLANDGTNRFVYDYKNQLIAIIRMSDSVVLVQYRYDVGGRRIAKIVGPAGTMPGTTLYFYENDQVIAETTGTGTLKKRFIYHDGIDRPVVMDTDISGDGVIQVATERFFYHTNSLGTVYALSDNDGLLEEAYTYDAFGEVLTIITGYGADQQFGGTGADADTVITETAAIGNPYRFHARRFDFEEGAGLYYYRARYYRPDLGRFISADPMGAWHDSYSLGNRFTGFGNNAVNMVDPSGEAVCVRTKGCEIWFYMVIEIRGRWANLKYAKEMENAINSIWNRSGGWKVGRCTVHFDIQVRTRKNAGVSWKGPGPKDSTQCTNVIKIRTAPERVSGTHGVGGNTGDWARRGNTPLGRWQRVQAHESGHLMGLDDLYDEAGTVGGKRRTKPRLGEAGGMMAGGVYRRGKLQYAPHTADIQRLLKANGVKCPCDNACVSGGGE
ncbi:RHS repeat protein [bacterium AH-315-F18]|nr:RHS repeat protein [bacterium AH-315-F18]